MRLRLELKVTAVILSAGLLCPDLGYAVVGQAERFDEIEESELQEFHQGLTNPKLAEQLDQADETMKTIKKKKVDLSKSGEVITEQTTKELEDLKRQLLSLPKRDRFRTEVTGAYQYDSNIARKPLRQEKDDSVMDVKPTILFDLSGRKTDLRLEFGASRQWNVEFPEKDSWQADERLRYRRKYFKKLTSSGNSIISRNNSKTVEINEPKIRWDLNNQSALNWAFSRKLSMNFTMGSSKRYFPQEAFDQDSGYQVTASPSAFYNITPKSRVSLGYSLGGSRARTKSGDSNSHDINAGYFGKITKKSSMSATLAFNHQTPKSRDTAVSNTYTAGIGYIWQMTGKTQMTTQIIRSLQNSTSDLVSGDVNGENVTSKSDTHFTNDSISLSLNTRLNTKLSTNFTVNGSRVKTVAFKDGDKDSETMQIMFPVSWTITYFVRRWLALNFGYTFTYRVGNEENDFFRSHLLRANMRLSF